MRSCPPEKKKGGYLSRPPEEKEAAKEDGEECDAIALHENSACCFRVIGRRSYSAKWPREWP